MAVFTAIASAITAISGWTISLGALGSFAIGNFLLRSAVQLGVSALAKAFAGDKSPRQDPFAIQGQIRTGGAVPRSFVLGPGLTAGSLVWHSEWGKSGNTPNAYYTQVIALSDLPVAGLRRWFVNGQAMTLADTGDERGLAAVELRTGGTDNAWVRFHDGTQTAADSFLTGTVSAGAPRTYSATRIGTGIAYAVVTFRIKSELFSGFPASKFVLDGVKLYDPSKDDTAGGSGGHRWNDRTTWGGDGDALPAVQAYNLARGLTFGGAWFYGLQGVTAARLPAAHWIGQIQKCRVEVEGDNGPEPIYRAGGEISVSAEIGDAFEALLTACAGRMSEVGGTFKLFVGAPDPAVVTITDEDIVSLAPQTFTPFFGLSNTVNGVLASYPSPDEGYVMRALPPLYNPAFEVEDGGRRLLTDIALTLVPFRAQATRLVEGELAAARRARRHTFTLPARYRLLEPGDVLQWNSVRNGYSGKLFRVDGVIDLPNCDLIVDVTEVDPSDHAAFDFDPGAFPALPAPLTPVRPAITGVIGLKVSPTDLSDNLDAPRRPAILAEWTASVDGVAGVIFEIRPTDGDSFKAETRDFADGRFPISTGILPGVEYQVRARYVPIGDLECRFGGWLLVNSNDTRLSMDDFAPDLEERIAAGEAASANLAALVGDYTGTLDDEIARINSDIDAAAQSAAADKAAAEGSASVALEQSQLAADARDEAEGAASAASDSAAFALARANEAGEAATSASESEQNAATSEANSLSSQMSAATSETNAAGSEARAVQAEGLAVSVVGRGVSVLSSQFLDQGWLDWNVGPTVGSNEVYAVGKTWHWSVVNEDAGCQLVSDGGAWSGVENADAYVVEVDYELVSGSIGGAGFLFDWIFGGATHRVTTALADCTNGPIGVGRLMTARRVVERPAGAAGAFDKHSVFFMANFAPTGPKVAKSLKVHRFSIFPASEEDRGRGMVQAAYEGYAYSRASVDGALAGLSTNLMAEIDSVNASLEQDYLTASDVNGALAAMQTTLSAGAAPGYQEVLDAPAKLSLGNGGNGTILSGGAVLGQAGSVIVRETAHARDGSGNTTGSYFVIPTERALQFAGKRIKISVMAKKAPANSATKFGVTYSTSDTGNSGYMLADKALADWWQWFDFYYDVPMPNTGGGDILGLYGDDAQMGNGTHVSRVTFEVVPQGKDMPEFTQLEASVTTHAAALSDLSGNASAGYLIRAQAGNVVSLLDLVAADGASGGVSIAKIEARDILLSGSVTMPMLSVGNGKNLFNDAQFATGVDLLRLGGSGGSFNQSILGLQGPGPWAGQNYQTVRVQQSGTATDGYTDVLPRIGPGQTDNRCLPAKEHQWYEASAYTSTHRCTGRVFMRFLDENGVQLDAPWSAFGEDGGSSVNPDAWQRRWLKAKAPAGTAFVQPFFRKFGTTSGSNSFLFLHKPMLAECHAEATDPAPWSPGGQTIVDGGMVQTGAIASNNYIPGSIGWIIDTNGNAELNNLVVRGWIKQGALTDGGVEQNATQAYRGHNTVVCEMYLGSVKYNEFWHFAAVGEIAGPGETASWVYKTELVMQYRTLESGVWSSFTNVWYSGAMIGAATWRDKSDTYHFASKDYDNVHVRLVLTVVQHSPIDGATGAQTLPRHNSRNMALIVQSMTRK